MATRSLKAQVELSGEAKYKAALQELNSGNKVLASEMRKLSAEFKGQAESTEFLTRKGDLLERQLQQQKDKVEQLKAAVSNAAEKYGEASTKTQNWIVKLNNAEAQQYELEHAIKENNQALSRQGEEMTGLGNIVDKFANKLGVNIPEGAKEALNGVKGFSAGTVAAMGAAAAAVAATTAVYKKLFNLVLDESSKADEVLTESLATGLSTKVIQQYEYAANLIDVPVDVITGSLAKLTRVMDDARNGNAELIKNFSDLRVSITDINGQLRPAQEVWEEAVVALGQMENATERDAAANNLFGRSFQELNPLVVQGMDVLHGYMDEAMNTGYVLDEYQIKKLGEVDDAYQRMQLQLEANRKQLAVEFAPAAIEAFTEFSNIVTKAGKFLVDSGIITGLGSILESILGIIGAGADIMATITGIDGKFSILGATLSGVAQLLAIISDATNLITSVVTLDLAGIKNAVGLGYNNGNPNNYQRVKMQQTGQWEYYNSYYGSNASGNDNWRGGMTYINEAGPEAIYLPRGTQIATAQETRELGGDTFNFYIDAKNVQELVQLVEMAKTARIRRRMKGEG